MYDLNQITKESQGRVGDCRGYFTAVAGLRRRRLPMYLFFKRPVALLLFVILAFLLAARGMVPAMSKIDSDFPNYFTAAKIVAESYASRFSRNGASFRTDHRLGIHGV